MTDSEHRKTFIIQREKIYAILRAKDDWMVTTEIQKICHNSGDKAINMIAIPTIRRCLQELRDHRPPMARQFQPPVRQFANRFNTSTEWYGVQMDVSISNV